MKCKNCGEEIDAEPLRKEINDAHFEEFLKIQKISSEKSEEIIYYRQVLKELAAEVAVLQWKPITPENLPKVGDEVGGASGISSYPWVCKSVSAGMEKERNALSEESAWGRLGFTHFRPINPPVQKREAK